MLNLSTISRRRNMVVSGLFTGLTLPSLFPIQSASAELSGLNPENQNATRQQHLLHRMLDNVFVSERLDLKNNVVLSVSVGPPNSAFLKTKDTSSWDAKDVARSVLSDKSTARMTTGQRVAEISIVAAFKEEVDGILYWHYEYLVQKSPTISQQGLDVFRHSLAVTAEREGYLYSLNASTLDSRWTVMEPLFRTAVSSFHLLPPTPEYVPPYKDPWRFW